MKREVTEKLTTLIIGAFGLVAALAWNSAIQKIFQEFFPSANGVIAMFIYALAVTIIAVYVTIYLGKINTRK
jgi:hypothetical protein